MLILDADIDLHVDEILYVKMDTKVLGKMSLTSIINFSFDSSSICPHVGPSFSPYILCQ